MGSEMCIRDRDHTGGNLELLKQNPALEIIGPAHDAKRIPGMTRGVSQGETFDLGRQIIHVFETPGHTTSHIIFYVPDAKAAFVGDTLFKMGCGRLFEGSAHDMFDSMAKIAALPDDTQLYCAHEYTLSNGAFALTVDADNRDLHAEMTTAKALRDKGLPTVPTSVGLEKKINPFMRAETPERLGDIRRAKDNF